MDFDDVLVELGELGKFQITTYALVCLPVLFAAANSLSYVFTAGVPNYRCYVPNCDDPWIPNYYEDWVQFAVPGEKTSTKDNFKPEHCLRYLPDPNVLEDNRTCSSIGFLNDVEECSEWVFDEERTIVNEWNITCLGNQWKLSLVGTSHFAGIIVGSGIFGVLADRYGRKLIFILCIMIMSLSGMLQVISPEYITFTTLIFVNAFGTSGVYPLAFIIGVEMVGKKKREVTGMALNYFYAIGEAIVALIAWMSLDWRIVQLAVSAPPILFLVYYWIVPESVRWLLAKDKNKKAKVIVIRAAKINGVTLSTAIVDAFDEETSILKKKPEMKESTDILPTIRKMLSHRKLVVRFTIVYFIWAVNAFVYYGLSVNSTSMSGDKYLNFALVCLVEIPGYSLAWIAIRKIGRKWALVISLLLCGITCGLTLLVPIDVSWPTTILFLTGKLGVTAAFSIVYVHTAEMLPTVIRSGGVGSASTVARFGALLAPFVPLLGVYVQPLPMIMFGSVAVLAGLLALKLPETLGNKLPETVEDALNI